MKTNRRNFFKVVAGGLGYIALQAIMPFDSTLAHIKPEDKHPKDVVCQDFVPQINVYEYNAGETIPYQDIKLPARQCANCKYSAKGMCQIYTT